MAKYRREKRFPVSRNLSFSQEQADKLDALADRDERSVSDIVRECVDLQYPAVSDRRRKKQG